MNKVFSLSPRRLNSLLLLLSLITLTIACLVGSTPIGLDRLIAVFSGASTSADQVVIFDIRLPRALAAYLVGAALGISGAALQGLLRNPLADPGVLGVSASAALAATFTLYFGLVSYSAFVLPVAAIAGALIATAFLSIAAIRISNVITLILVGVGISSFAGALMSLLMNLAPNPFSLSDMINWMLGTVANRSQSDIGFALPFLLLGFGILFFNRRNLSALTLGEEAAAGIGLNLRQARLLVVIGSGICTGAAVSLAGAVGFVGIIAPHLIRPFVKYEPAATLLPSALLAGSILVIADIIVRILPTDTELKLGVVAALIGAPAFVWIASRRAAHYD